MTVYTATRRAYRVDYVTSYGNGGYICVVAKTAAAAKRKAKEQIMAYPSEKILIEHVSDMGPA